MIFNNINYLIMTTFNRQPFFKIKGYNSHFINLMVNKSFYKGINISNDINIKVNNIIKNYNINDCIKLILSYGDFQDAFLKYNDPIFLFSIDRNNKLLFYRTLVINYIKDIINIQIEIYINDIILYNNTINSISDKTCVICLNSINNKECLTSCKHIFHLTCLSKWYKKNKTCPTCRANI